MLGGIPRALFELGGEDSVSKDIKWRETGSRTRRSNSASQECNRCISLIAG